MQLSNLITLQPTTMKDLLEQYVRYNHWANGRIIEVVLEHAMDKLDVEVVSSFPSLRKTLYHVWDAETIWMHRLKGTQANQWYSKEFTGNLEQAFEHWLEASAWFISFVVDKSEEELGQVCHYTNMKGDAFANQNHLLVMHIMNHSSFHRGQMVTILRQLGVTEIPSTDFVFFLRNQTK